MELQYLKNYANAILANLSKQFLKKEKKTIFLSAENWMYVEKNHVQKERR
jgi:hypothetical protein